MALLAVQPYSLCLACSESPRDQSVLLRLQAVKERKRCVTAHWLNTVLKKKRLVPPHRALHFPVAFPPGGRPCSQHVRLTPPPLPGVGGRLLPCPPWAANGPLAGAERDRHLPSFCSPVTVAASARSHGFIDSKSLTLFHKFLK